MRTMLWILAVLVVQGGASAPVHASGDAVPVLEAGPACKHDKLGVVAAKEGTEVRAGTKERNVPAADYRIAFRRLGDAAAERGANAVVLRAHDATFFTIGRGRSPRPVHVTLRGAAIRVLDPANCTMDPLDPLELQRRAINDRVEKVVPPPAAPTG